MSHVTTVMFVNIVTGRIKVKMEKRGPVLSRETPWKSAEELYDSHGSNHRCFRDGKFWIEIPEESGKKSWFEAEKEEIRSEIYIFLGNSYLDDGNGILVAFDPTKRDVDQVYDAYRAASFDNCNMIEADQELVSLAEQRKRAKAAKADQPTPRPGAPQPE